MQIWKEHSRPDILKSLEQEIAKAQAELRCAKADVEKAQNRLSFSLSAIHALKDREDPAEMKSKV
jgi:septal ring factor EnvC (AmiA/AmiB activator)